MLTAIDMLSAASQIITDGFVTSYLPPSIVTVPDRPGQRLFNVYLPDGYDPAGTTRYPVVYFLHGLGGNYATEEGLPLILDRAIAEGLIVPMIVIFVDGSEAQMAPGTPQFNGFWYVNAYDQDGTPVTMAQYEDYLYAPDGLLAYVDAHFNTIPSQPYRAMMGHSMGGYGNLWNGIMHPDKFSAFCSDSGTPPWVLYTDLANSNTMLFCNLVLTETGSTGIIEPGSLKKETNTIYSHMNAWSVLNADNTADYPFNVTLPFLMTSTQLPTTPILDSADLLISDTVTLERIAQKDPYNYIVTQSTTLHRQTIYLDAGNQEIANGVGAAYFSQQLSANLLDHEYVLTDGGHITCLAQWDCSRYLTNLQRISASFASGGDYADEIRAKLQGVMDITLSGNAQVNIAHGAILGIETSNMDDSVTNTDVTLTLQDNAHLIIGTDTISGGALQVGDRTTKARLQGMPSLGQHAINFSLILDGPGVLVQVGKEGFLGFGVGVDGQKPSQPNFWGVSSLVNVKSININGVRGTLKHTHIASGADTDASLICFGSSSLPALDLAYTTTQPPINYTWSFDPYSAAILGGGNIMQIVDALVMHPTLLTATGVAPALGARVDMDTDAYVSDCPGLGCLYDKNQASTNFYQNSITTGILSSDITLQDVTKVAQLPLNSVFINLLFDYLSLVDYEYQETKSTDFSIFKTPSQMGYVDEDLIQRTAQSTLIPVYCAALERIKARGGAGIKLVTRDGQRQILRMYDLNPLP